MNYKGRRREKVGSLPFKILINEKENIEHLTWENKYQDKFSKKLPYANLHKNVHIFLQCGHFKPVALGSYMGEVTSPAVSRFVGSIAQFAISKAVPVIMATMAAEWHRSLGVAASALPYNEGCHCLLINISKGNRVFLRTCNST